jgi:hypothetical protein
MHEKMLFEAYDQILDDGLPPIPTKEAKIVSVTPMLFQSIPKPELINPAESLIETQFRVKFATVIKLAVNDLTAEKPPAFDKDA